MNRPSKRHGVRLEKSERVVARSGLGDEPREKTMNTREHCSPAVPFTLVRLSCRRHGQNRPSRKRDYGV